MSILDKVRRWIDGETAELVLEQAARDAQIKPRSKGEEFIVKIARAVEAVMQAEMVPLPQGTTIIPSEYTIFLSSEDDKEWQGAKRKGLEQGLYHILAERAKEIAGRKKAYQELSEPDRQAIRADVKARFDEWKKAQAPAAPAQQVTPTPAQQETWGGLKARYR